MDRKDSKDGILSGVKQRNAKVWENGGLIFFSSWEYGNVAMIYSSYIFFKLKHGLRSKEKKIKIKNKKIKCIKNTNLLPESRGGLSLHLTSTITIGLQLLIKLYAGFTLSLLSSTSFCTLCTFLLSLYLFIFSSVITACMCCAFAPLSVSTYFFLMFPVGCLGGQFVLFAAAEKAMVSSISFIVLPVYISK